MATRLHNPAKSTAPREIIIAAAGGLSTADWNLDWKKSYQGRLYKLNSELSKSLTDLLGFTANFQLAGLRTAYMDLHQPDARIILEIARNTRPSDLGVRYTRQRWNLLDVSNKDTEGQAGPPLSRTEYEAHLSAEILSSLAGLLHIQAGEFSRFPFVRLDFARQFFTLLAEDSAAANDHFPPGFYGDFALPGQFDEIADNRNSTQKTELAPNTAKNETPGQMHTNESYPVKQNSAPDAAAPITGNDRGQPQQQQPADEGVPSFVIDTARKEILMPDTEQPVFAPRMPETHPGQNEAQNKAQYEGQAKYATYSRSEIDNMLKAQAESILNALSGKMASHQRNFQEAVEKQEKTFNKLVDNLQAQVDTSRLKLETTAKKSTEDTRAELEEFHKQLVKELEQYRAQINKSLSPITRSLEEKPGKPAAKDQKPDATAKPLKAAAVNKVPAPDKPLNNRILMAILFVAVLSVVSSFFNYSAIVELKQNQHQADTVK